MTNDTVKRRAGAQSAYKAPEVFEVGSAKKLIQGPMIQPYMDSPGSGWTQFRAEPDPDTEKKS